ncbi:MAG: hypothetical protein D3906_06685, partial [Candidatus Electrothrix sp. AUS1_2]|nr:hypothetical protein [Candidatus Electrothrix sp. AUS1_2]
MDIKNSIRKDVSEGDIESALLKLGEYYRDSNNSSLDEVIILSGRHRRLTKDERKGRITREVFEVESNRISNNILDFIEDSLIDIKDKCDERDCSIGEINAPAPRGRVLRKNCSAVTPQAAGYQIQNFAIKILLLAANPFAAEPLRLDEEIRKIKTNIQLARERDRLVFISALAVTPETLMQEMHDNNPDIDHFSGHGDTDGIYLEQDNGEPHFVDTDALEALFEHFKQVQCVLLNCCYSEMQ